MDWSSVLPPVFFLAMACLYWAFRALMWFVITPSTALESWVSITFLFIHCFQNTLFLVVHKHNEVISVIIELWHAWLRQTQLPCIADKCVEILVSTLSILDNINGTSGPPLPPITMMLKWHVLAPSRLSSLPFFGEGGGGVAGSFLCHARRKRRAKRSGRKESGEETPRLASSLLDFVLMLQRQAARSYLLRHSTQSYNLGQYKMEQSTPFPSKARRRAKSKTRHFGIIEIGGGGEWRSDLNVPFILSKIVGRPSRKPYVKGQKVFWKLRWLSIIAKYCRQWLSGTQINVGLSVW